MARALTADELTLLRTAGQYSELFLAIHKPATVYSARVNQATITNDGITEITYDGGSGTLANVLPGMTLYVGTTAGAYDKGLARIRKAPSGTKFYIGETSEINFADNDYLTVVDEFGLWAKHPIVPDPETAIAFFDYDIAYTDQHSKPDPVPVLGPPAVVWLTGATVSVAFDGSASWVLGGTITGYSWSAPGASATSGLTTATPTITYNAAGTYRVSCTVTASNEKTFTGYRYVFVYSAASMPATAFNLDNCAGDRENGGWSYTITMWDEASLANVRDRAMVILFAKDTYGGTQQSIGPVTGRENIIAVGWIAEESIKDNPELGSVEFTVQGPSWWMSEMLGYSLGVENVETVPTSWIQIQDLTVDKGLWHFLHWRSTATAMMDVVLSGDTRPAYSVEATTDPFWEQLDTMANKSILAKPLCDRYGRLFVEIDSQFMPTSERVSIPVVQELYAYDWQDTIEIERVTVPRSSRLLVSGWVCSEPGEPKPVFSLANGKIAKPHGKTSAYENLLLEDQDQANVLAGLLMGWENNPFPRLDFQLASNHRMIDIAPRQYLQIDFAAEDTLRGFVCSNKKLIPRAVQFTHDAETGELLTNVEFEGETFGETAVTATRPQTPVENIPDGPGIVVPDWPLIPVVKPVIFPPQPFIPTDPDAPGTPCRDGTDTSANGPWSLGLSGTLNSVSPSSVYMPYHVWMRPGSSPNPTRYTIDVKFYDLVGGAWVEDTDGDDYNVYAVNCAGARIAPGVHDPVVGGSLRTGTFNPAAGADICGIEIAQNPEAFDFVDADHTITFATASHTNDALGAFSHQGYATRAIAIIGLTESDATLFGCGMRLDIGFHFGASMKGKLVRVKGTTIAQPAPPHWKVWAGTELQEGDALTFDVEGHLTSEESPTINANAQVNAGGGTHMALSLVVEVYAIATRKMVISSANLWNICSSG